VHALDKAAVEVVEGSYFPELRSEIIPPDSPSHSHERFNMSYYNAREVPHAWFAMSQDYFLLSCLSATVMVTRGDRVGNLATNAGP
jgi:hypothetical protein